MPQHTIENAARPAVAAEPLSVILHVQHCADCGAGLSAWRAYLNGLKRPFEIILVRPANVEFAGQTSADFLFDALNGVGFALTQAFRAAKHPLVVTATCDRQYQPTDLDRFLQIIDQVDLVAGFRALPVPQWRVILDGLAGLFTRVVLGFAPELRRTWLGAGGRARRRAARWLFGVRTLDPECPFRLYRRQALERIPLQARGSFAWVEILAKANHLGFLLAEEPATWTAPAEAPTTDASFARDALAVFRNPDFGPATLSAPEAVAPTA